MTPRPPDATALAGLPTRRRGRLRRVVTACAFFLMAALGLFATGWPQRKAIEFALSRALDVRAEVRGISSVGVLRIDEVRLYDSNAAQNGGEPAIVARNLAIDYALYPFPPIGEPFIRSVRVGSLELRLDASNPEHTNFEFLRRPTSGRGGKGPNPRFLPPDVDVGYVRAEVTMPEIAFAVDGIRVTGGFGGADRFRFNARTNAVRAAWWGDALSERTKITEGFADIEIAQEGKALHANVLMAVPGYIEAQGFVSFPDTDGDELKAGFPTLRVYGSRLPSLTQVLLPVPIQFDVLDVTGLSLETSLKDPLSALPDTNTKAAAQGLVVGPADRPLFAGDAVLEGTIRRHTQRAEFALTLNEEQTLFATFEGNSRKAQFTGRFADWPKDAVTRLAPADFKQYVEPLDFAWLDGSFTFDWSDPAYSVDASITSRGSAREDGGPILVTVAGQGSTAEAPLFAGNFNVRFGEGSAGGTVLARSREAYAASVTLAKVEAAPWAGFFGKEGLPADLVCTVSGDITLAAEAGAEPIVVTPALVLAPFAYGDFAFERMSVAGGLRATRSLDRITADRIAIETETMNAATVRDLSVVLEPLTVAARIEAHLDVMTLAKASGAEGVYGELVLDGAVVLEEGVLSAPFTLQSDFLGYGDYAVPYGQTVTGSGRLRFDMNQSEGALDELIVALGEGTELRVGPTVFVTDTPSVRGEFAFRTDLALAVDMGLLAGAKGSAVASGRFDYAGERLRAEWTGRVEAAELVLPEQMATGKGLLLAVSGTYREGFEGAGRASAGEVSAAGGVASDVSGLIELKGEDVLFRELTASVFGGRFAGEAEIGVLRKNMPVRLAARFEGIDLDRFTREVQPPEVKLTGIASGSATVGYASSGLTQFALHATSTENFSLNRDMVEHLLRNPQFRGILGAGQIERTMERFIGRAPQRPFDSAEMELRLEEGRIRGETVLKSEKTREYNGLNLTIDLAIDPEALGQALLLLEQSEVTGVRLDR